MAKRKLSHLEHVVAAKALPLPAKKKKRSPPRLKFKEVKTTVEGAVTDAFAELTSLAEECREIVDNATDGIRDTQRVQTFDSTADTLEALDEPTVESPIGDIEVTYSEQLPRRKGRGLSRADRCSNACNILDAIAGALTAKTEEPDFEKGPLADFEDDMDALRDECESAKGDAEGCEFPGMYG